MELELKQLEGRLKTNALTLEDKNLIEKLYLENLGKILRRTSCGDCYRDAVIEIKLKLRKNMTTPKYILKNGVLLYQHSTGRSLNNTNITDQDAREHLQKHPDDLKFFAQYPARELADEKVINSTKKNTTPKNTAPKSLQKKQTTYLTQNLDHTSDPKKEETFEHK